MELLSSYILIQFELLEVAGLLLLFCLRESCHATGGRITLETCIAHAAFCVCLFYYPSLTNLPFVVTSKGWPIHALVSGVSHSLGLGLGLSHIVELWFWRLQHPSL